MTQRFFDCSISGCSLPSVRNPGSCEHCSLHFCATHWRSPLHTCSLDPPDEATFELKIRAEVRALRAALNESALRAVVSKLSDGRECVIKHPPAIGKASMMGTGNYHARVRIVNGPTWILRIPRSGEVPFLLLDYLIGSEYATLKYLSEKTRVPVPRVFGYGLFSATKEENPVGCGYILMEEVPGRPWGGQGSKKSKDKVAGSEDRRHVWKGVADILIELRRYPFPAAGSLLYTNGKFDVSATASDHFLTLGPHGPYHSEIAYYEGYIEQYLELIASRQRFPAFSVNAYLVFMFLKSQIPSLCSKFLAKQFFLKHVDDTGGHLMVDDDLNITGVIDWQRSRVVPFNEAFGPSLVTADMEDMYDGVSGLTVEDEELAEILREKGAEELADVMARDEKLRRFFFVSDIDCTKWEDMYPLVKGIWAVFGLDEKTEWKSWKKQALKTWKDDSRLKSLIKSS
ncbi:hypothetical protein EDC01DRAFT_643569 [Geopyxis carbonaria]|nr:hypothetical protein EDC01DRAFT_643569 [Geopyxis carbonaria]